MGTEYTDFANLPVPDSNAADQVPYWLSLMADQLDTTTFLTATSLTDRDARYFRAPSGVICVVRESDGTIDGVYIKTSGAGTSTWQTIWVAPTAVVWTDLTLVSGYVSRQPGQFDPQIRMENAEFATMKGGIAKDDGTAIVNGTLVAYLPAGFSTPRYLDLPIATNTNALGTTASSTPKISINPNLGSITFFGPANITWIGLDLYRFSTLY